MSTSNSSASEIGKSLVYTEPDYCFWFFGNTGFIKSHFEHIA